MKAKSSEEKKGKVVKTKIEKNINKTLTLYTIFPADVKDKFSVVEATLEVAETLKNSKIKKVDIHSPTSKAVAVNELKLLIGNVVRTTVYNRKAV